MEEKISQLVDITNYKYRQTFNIVTINSNSSIYLPQPIELNPNRNYELGLKYFSVVNSIQNVTNENNKIRYSKDGGATWIDHTFTPGSYELNDFTEFLNDKTNDVFNIEFVPQASLNRVQLVLRNNRQVDFTIDNSVREMFGFQNRIYRTTQIATYRAKLENNIKNIYIKCNLIDGGYINDKKSQVLLSLPAFATPVGHRIIKEIEKPIYLPLLFKTISSINLRVVDDNDKEIDFGGEEISMLLHLKQI